MSSLSVPLSLDEYVSALHPLPNSSLFAERHRLLNSIHHLLRSNIALLEFPDDEDCISAIVENEAVISRQKLYIQSIKSEVERRGVSITDHREDGDEVESLERVNGDVTNGAVEESVGSTMGLEDVGAIPEATDQAVIAAVEEEGEGRVNALLRGEDDVSRAVQGDAGVTIAGRRVDLVVREGQAAEDQGVYL